MNIEDDKMKIIDVHTHFYPDAIAGEVVQALRKPGQFEPCCDGTVGGLRRFMATDGVAVSVNLPVATKKEQVAGINRKMIAFNRASPGDVVCFGAMHPAFGSIGNIEEEIDFLACSGVRGIKLHPEYQQFYPDDPKMARIYEACKKYGLIVMFHAGFDFPYPEHIHATPERLKEVASIRGLAIIYAHLGSYRMWDGVLKHLVATDTFFDTSYTSEIDEGLMAEVIQKHGVERVLFGSDFPWCRAETVRQKLEKAVPDEASRRKICHENAEKLLGIAGGKTVR